MTKEEQPITIDPTTGNIIVADTTEPGTYEVKFVKEDGQEDSIFVDVNDEADSLKEVPDLSTEDVSVHLESLFGKDAKTMHFAIQWGIRKEGGKIGKNDKKIKDLVESIKEKSKNNSNEIVGELAKTIDFYHEELKGTYDVILRSYIIMHTNALELLKSTKENRQNIPKEREIKLKIEIRDLKNELEKTKGILLKQEYFIREVEAEMRGGQRVGGDLHRTAISPSYNLKTPFRFSLRSQIRAMVADLYKEFDKMDKNEKSLADAIKKGDKKQVEDLYKEATKHLKAFNELFENLTKRMYTEQYVTTLSFGELLGVMRTKVEELSAMRTSGSDPETAQVLIEYITEWHKKISELHVEQEKLLHNLREQNNVLGKNLDELLNEMSSLEKTIGV